MAGPRGRVLRALVAAPAVLIGLCLSALLLHRLVVTPSRVETLPDVPSLADYPHVLVAESQPFKDILGYFDSAPSRNAPKKFAGGGKVPTRSESAWPPGGAPPGSPSLRVIVLTMNRDASLERLLASLSRADYDGDRVDLDIWIDRLAKGKAEGDAMQSRMLSVARSYDWPYGVRTIHARQENAGLYEQWIYTWNVTEETTEAAVILEDDLEVSKHFYVWLKEARAKYASDPAVAAFTLQRGELRPRQVRGVATGKLVMDEVRHPVYKYRLLGTWGFAPEKRAWLEFRAWYEESREIGVRPYVTDLMTTDWYKSQEKGGPVAKTMWSQWFIKFADVKDYFTVYANLPGRTTLASNYREVGMHYDRHKPPSADFPVYKGPRSGLTFPEAPVYLDWDGREIPREDLTVKFRRGPA